MKWRGREGSRNIEDRRRMGGGTVIAGGGLGMLALLAIGYFMGLDVRPLLQQTGSVNQQATTELTETDREAGEFVSSPHYLGQ